MKIILHQPPGTICRRVSATFEIGNDSFDVFFDSSDQDLIASPEGFLALGLLPAMKSGEGIEFNYPISRQIFHNLDEIQSIYHSWNRKLKRIELSNPELIDREGGGKKHIGLFYSGGLDSGFSLLSHKDSISDLIMIQDGRSGKKQSVIRSHMQDTLSRISESFGYGRIEVETNARELLNPFVDWGAHGHGAVLFATAHFLSHCLGQMIIASTYSYASLHPWGSHPLLDPLWSSEEIVIRHDGCKANRIEKAQELLEYPVLMENLLVCWEHKNEKPNCGICEKCVRTMIDFIAAGGDGALPCFSHEFSLRLLDKIPFVTQEGALFMREDLDELEEQSRRNDIQLALRKLLLRSRMHRIIRPWVHRLTMIPGVYAAGCRGSSLLLGAWRARPWAR